MVVGGGQAGLAMSYLLQERGRQHIVLERNRVAERWQSERWNSLAFQFPNWAIRLPGFEYKGEEPDAFAHYTEIAKLLEDYARLIEAPIESNTEVKSLSKDPDTDTFIVNTTKGVLTSSNVVVATGPFQKPLLPGFASRCPSNVFQVHASQYRGPTELPKGAVLVVGSGASGCQIAEELYQNGRTVCLCVSRHRRAPRRYRGKDLTWWLLGMGRMDTRIDSFPDRKIPPSIVITGVDGGHDINIRHFGNDGVIVLGGLLGIDGNRLSFRDNAEEILAFSDNAFRDFGRAADQYAMKIGSGLSEEGLEIPQFEPVRSTPSLDLRDASITSIIWSTGHMFDFDWIQVPVFNDRGAPIQERGVTACPGLYFLGLHWMHTFKSGVLFGVGEDASYIAERIPGGIEEH